MSSNSLHSRQSSYSSSSSYIKYSFTDKEQVFDRRSFVLYLINILLYLIFSTGVIPDNIILSLMFVVFAISSLKLKCLLFLFSLPFCMVTVFSFGLTLSLIESSLLVLHYFFSNSMKKGKNVSFADAFSFFFFIFLLLEGILAYTQTKRTTGIGLAVYCLVSFVSVKQFYINRNNKEKPSPRFVELFFLGILISTFIGVIYGYLRVESSARYIGAYEGGTTVEQFRGTLGTTRFAIFTTISLIYPLFYVKNKIVKYLISATLVYFVFKSVSITAFIVMNLFFLYYIYITNIKIQTKCYATVIMMLGLILIVSNWNVLVMKNPVLTRVNHSYEALSRGDINSATSARDETNGIALDVFSKTSSIRKVVGSQHLGVQRVGNIAMFSHNSYLDMLIYFGYIGTLLFFIKIFPLLLKLRYTNRSVFHQFVLLKMVFILSAASVSVFNAPYWFVLVVL